MVLSWIVSPILSGIIVAILYGLIRTFVLRSKHSFTRAFYVSPSLAILVICTCWWLFPRVMCTSYIAISAKNSCGRHEKSYMVTDCIQLSRDTSSLAETCIGCTLTSLLVLNDVKAARKRSTMHQ